jgi:hypothetical protein
MALMNLQKGASVFCMSDTVCLEFCNMCTQGTVRLDIFVVLLYRSDWRMGRVLMFVTRNFE